MTDAPDQRQQHQRRRASDRVRLAPIVWAFIALTGIFFGTVAGFSWVVIHVNDNAQQLTTLVAENRRLLKENENRIADIQAARIESCQRTYGGISEVFSPFFPTMPRTPEQISRIEKFNQTINKLQADCAKQTGQEGG